MPGRSIPERRSRRLTGRAKRTQLKIRAYTTFAMRWLIPRLSSFHAANPGIEVLLTASMPSGWAYLRVPEPGNGQYILRRVQRSDELLLELKAIGNDQVGLTKGTSLLRGRGEPVRILARRHQDLDGAQGRNDRVQELVDGAGRAHVGSASGRGPATRRVARRF